MAVSRGPAFRVCRSLEGGGRRRCRAIGGVRYRFRRAFGRFRQCSSQSSMREVRDKSAGQVRVEFTLKCGSGSCQVCVKSSGQVRVKIRGRVRFKFG